MLGTNSHSILRTARMLHRPQLQLTLVVVLLTRKVLTSPVEVEMWGDGKQTRSFTFIDDCVEGVLRITKSDCSEPLNLGNTEMVSMNRMMEMVG